VLSLYLGYLIHSPNKDKKNLKIKNALCFFFFNFVSNMNSTEELFLCNYCLKVYSNENIRQVKLRAVEFIRDYLDQRLIKYKFFKTFYIFIKILLFFS